MYGCAEVTHATHQPLKELALSKRLSQTARPSPSIRDQNRSSDLSCRCPKPKRQCLEHEPARTLVTVLYSQSSTHHAWNSLQIEYTIKGAFSHLYIYIFFLSFTFILFLKLYPVAFFHITVTHNDLSVYSAPKGETGADEFAEVWTHKN